MYIADTVTGPDAIALAALGILGGAVVTIGSIARFALKSLGRDLREHTKAALQQTASNNELRKSVVSFDTYLRDRNGRDSELHKENIKAIKEIVPSMQKIADASIHSILESTQVVPEQRVEHQHIEQAVLESPRTKK